MAPSNNPALGVSYLFRALPLLTRPGIKSYVLIPLTINILLFSIGIYFGFVYFSEYMDRALDTRDMWDWVAALVEIFKPVLYVLFTLTLLVVIFFSFSILANIIAAPFNALLSEATERYLTGKTAEDAGGMKQVVKDVIPTVLMEIRKLLYMALWSIPFLILLLVIPIVGPVIWFLFTAWMMSLEYMDYPMGNHRITFREQRKVQAKCRLMSLGFGSVTMGASMIPLVNFIVMPTAVIAATILWVEQYKPRSSCAE